MAVEGLGVSELASRYAAALFDLADEAKAHDAVAADLATIQDLLQGSEDLRTVTRSPLVPRDQQGAAVEAVLAEAKIGDIVRHFVGVVAANRRLFALPAMIRAYLAELARRRGEERARVVSAKPLKDEQSKSVTEALRKAMGSKVSVDFEVDEELIGGLVVQVGSRMIDTSVRSQLQRLQTAMRGA